MTNKIEVLNLVKSYKNLEAVKGISFTVKEGSFFSFLGPNGAGKSTTINIISSLLSKTSGNVLINGVDVENKMEAKKQIGVVFQQSLLDDRLTVEENLDIRSGFYYQKRSKQKSAVQNCLKITQTEAIAKRPYGKLSGGQRRRVDIARALIHTPSLLILDEPTTGLDPQTRKMVWKTLLNLKKETGMTLFLTTHYMEEAEYSDYITVIDHGKIIEEGTPLSLKSKLVKDRLVLYPNNIEKLSEILISKKISFKQKNKCLILALNKTIDSIPLIKSVQNELSEYEVIRGTLDDVFIQLTGKEIRD